MKARTLICTAMALVAAGLGNGCRPKSENAFESLPEAHPVGFTAYLVDPRSPTSALVESTVENRDGLAVVDGDIVLGKVAEIENQSASKSLQYLDAKLWEGGKVPYELASGFPNRDVVFEAIEEFHQKTGIKFVARTTEKDYLVFTTTANPAIGGQSYFGRKGGRQELWLNQDTARWNRGVVIHELCHALTVAHEHCRANRDANVQINWDNIVPFYRQQFSQLFGAGRDVGEYDYDSIMHYPAKAFSRNGGNTIVPLKNGVVLNVAIGQREKLSLKDIEGLYEIYKTAADPEGPPITPK